MRRGGRWGKTGRRHCPPSGSGNSPRQPGGGWARCWLGCGPGAFNGGYGLVAPGGGTRPTDKFDGGDDVDELAEALFVEAGAGVVLGKDAFEAWVVALDGDHGIIDDFADRGLLGVCLKVGPAGVGGYPENVFRLVFVRVFGICPGVVPFACQKLGSMLLEGIRDVFQEDQTQDNVLVLRRVHVIAELVGGEPELGLEADVGSSLGFGCFLLGHGRANSLSVCYFILVMGLSVFRKTCPSRVSPQR